MTFHSGDLVFAKVKGYSAWPARITSSEATGGAEKFSVVFFGTNEYANVSTKNLWQYSDFCKKKFATPARMKKIKFAKAIEEIDSLVSAPSVSHQEAEQSEHLDGGGVVSQGAENGTGKEDEQVGVVTDVGGKKRPEKKQKKKILPLRNINQNLQDDEAKNIKNFREKIIEEDIGYSCRFCDFASGNKILAKTHAAHCGLVQQTRRKRPKTYHCIECSDIFSTKSALDKHFMKTHTTSSYLCSTCGYKTTTRNNYVRHLRIHDRKYSPSYKCDFCDFKAKDNWHLDKHSLSHFKNTNSKSINGPLNTFCAMKVDVSLTEIQVYDVCRSMYEMTISRASEDDEEINGEEINWAVRAETAERSFCQLGMQDSDWTDWLQISCALGLSSCQGFMSWVEYSKEGESEIYRVCIEEGVDRRLEEGFVATEFIEDLYNDVCGGNMLLGENPSKEVLKACQDLISEIVEKAMVKVETPAKIRCNFCEKSFKDKTHLSEHEARMHSEPTPCLICNVVFQDKLSALAHQKFCTRRCSFDHCSFQTRHKHAFLKHLRGHEQKLRRFRASFPK